MTITDVVLDRAMFAYDGNQSPLIGDSDHLALYLAEQRIKMRAALTAALSAMPAPDAAEFEAAVENMITGYRWFATTQSRDPYRRKYLDKYTTARRALLDLFMRSRLAGVNEGRQAALEQVRELRQELTEYGALQDHPDEWDKGFVAFKEIALDQIDAMLVLAGHGEGGA